MSFSSFISTCENNQNVNLTHLICVSKDEILFQYCKPPYEMNCLRLFFSMTKSFSSLAIGIASDLKLLDINDLVVDLLKEYLPEKDISDNLKKVRVRDILTMSSGIHDNTYSELFTQDNWITAFLNQEFPHMPGTFYRYSTHGSHMLSAIITKVSHLSLEDFLNKYLFYPMDILEAQWELSPEGLTAGGMGLSLYPYSLAKISQMLLNKGTYYGKRLISENYLKLATTQQIIKQEHSEKIYGGSGYGFQFHVGKNDYYRADGAFGQVCLICPQENLAIIAFSQYSKTEELLELIYNNLLDKQLDTSPLLKLKLNNKNISNSNNSVEFSNAIYKLDENILDIGHVKVDSNSEGTYLSFIYNSGISDEIPISFSEPSIGEMHFVKDLQVHLQSFVCYAIYDKGLELTIYYIETPYIAKYKITFSKEAMRLDFSINVSFNLKQFTVMGMAC